MRYLFKKLKLIFCIIFIICTLLITSQTVVNAAVSSIYDPRINEDYETGNGSGKSDYLIENVGNKYMRTEEEKKEEQKEGKSFINFYDPLRKINWYNIDDSSYEEKMVAWYNVGSEYSLSNLRERANDSEDEEEKDSYFNLSPEKVLMRPVSQGTTFSTDYKGLYCIRPVDAMKKRYKCKFI